jgi:hypothetical protein
MVVSLDYLLNLFDEALQAENVYSSFPSKEAEEHAKDLRDIMRSRIKDLHRQHNEIETALRDASAIMLWTGTRLAKDSEKFSTMAGNRLIP